VYQKIIQLLYIDELLEMIKQKFCETFGDLLADVQRRTQETFEFEDIFVKLLNDLEDR